MNNILDNRLLLLKAFIAFGLIIFGVRLHLIHTLGDYMPYWDDWGMGGLLYDHITRGLTFHDITRDMNEHRQVFGRLLAVALFEFNNHQWDTIVMMIANAVTWTITGLFLIHIIISHRTEIAVTPAIAIVLIIWTYPISLVNTLWGVQSHVYFMTLFAVLGSWYVAYPLFSARWCLGIFCLIGGGLTLAGGSFIGVSVASVYFVYAWADKDNRKHHLWTGSCAGFAGAFGVYLIAIQSGGGVSNFSDLDFMNWFLTFTKTMAWPVRTHVWPFFIFIVPILIIFKNLLSNNINKSKLVPFLLSIYGFVVIIAIAIASARSSEGSGPARRYADFLALAFVASSFALLFIQQQKFRLPKTVNQLLVVAWVITAIIAIPYRLEVLLYTLEDRDYIIPHQEENVRQFINSNDESWLEGKNFRQVPFPRPLSLGRSLTKFQAEDILPYQLQKPLFLISNTELNTESTFIYNGLFFASNMKFGDDLFGEPVIGSYNISAKGNKGTGKFISKPFVITRNYAMVPIIGYTGFPGMSLKMVNIETKQEIDIKPKIRSSLYAETWREILVKAPHGQYQLIAEDQNDELWFGFAAPRSVGRLSYWAQTSKQYGQWVWFFGLCFLLIIFRNSLVGLISNKQMNN